MKVNHLLYVAATMALSGCVGIPADGPSEQNHKSQAAGRVDVAGKFPYELVTLAPVTADIANAGHRTVLSQAFTDRRPAAEIKIGVGDVVGVTIFESAAGGLFIPSDAGSRAGNFVALPNQVVDRAGFISVPYAGAVRAAGRTPSQVQADVVDKLSTRAIEPQVVVSLIDQRSQLVSILGEVNEPVLVPVTASGERLLDSVARASGIKGNGVDLWLRLIRDGREKQVPFTSLTSDPRNNIYTLPNDTIYLYRDPSSYLAFGASGSQGQFNFDLEHLTLAEAVAKAGGLLDDRAEPKAVFLYRKESRETARRLGIDVSKYDGRGYTTASAVTNNTKVVPVADSKYASVGHAVADDRDEVPVIYSLNLREPQGYFTATQFQMQNKDVIFVSNAATVDVAKFLQLLRIGVATVREGNAGALELD